MTVYPANVTSRRSAHCTNIHRKAAGTLVFTFKGNLWNVTQLHSYRGVTGVTRVTGVTDVTLRVKNSPKDKKWSKYLLKWNLFSTFAPLFESSCCCSSGVEHFLGKEEVVSSILINSSKIRNVTYQRWRFLFYILRMVELTTSEVLLCQRRI